MTEKCENCNGNPVDIARNTQGTPTAKLIAILEANGITNASELAEIVGISDRAIRKSRNHSSGTPVPGGTAGPELQDRSGTPVPKTEPQFRNSSSEPSRAHANTESLRDTLVSKTEDSSLSEPDVSDQGEEATPKAKRRHSYTHGFEEFWKAYPDTTNNSKPEAFKQWRMLTSVEQHNATSASAAGKAIPARRTV
jgi:hypothetical protein